MDAIVKDTKEAALTAIKQATLIAENFQKRLQPEDIIQKEDLSLVTVGDFLCQLVINRHLLTSCPHIPIMGEEDCMLLSQNPHFKSRFIEAAQEIDPHLSEQEILDLVDSGGYEGNKTGAFWVVDPIDGTRGYVNKNQYAIALALIVDGQVLLGGLGCPDLPSLKGAILFSIKGQGTHIHMPTLIYNAHVNKNQAPKEIIYCEQTLSSKKHSHTLAHDIVKKLNAQPKPFRMDSQCKYALVAAGQASIYLRVPNSLSKEKLWDHAPGTIVVEEAGGIVTDLHGKLLDFSHGKTLMENFGIVATNRTLHSQVIQAAKHVLIAP